jgi:hypothetical protein
VFVDLLTPFVVAGAANAAAIAEQRRQYNAVAIQRGDAPIVDWDRTPAAHFPYLLAPQIKPLCNCRNCGAPPEPVCSYCGTVPE